MTMMTLAGDKQHEDTSIKTNLEVEILRRVWWAIVTKAADKSSNPRAEWVLLVPERERWTLFFIDTKGASVERSGL